MGVGVCVGAGVGLGAAVGVGVGAGVEVGMGVVVGAGAVVGWTSASVAVGTLASPPQAANRNVISPIKDQAKNTPLRNIVDHPPKFRALS